MNKNLTELVLVVDRSGSMQSRKEDAEGGINSLIQEQAKQEGECILTLVQFDTEYDFVYRRQPIKCVDKYTLIPRGCTALLDAVGQAINQTGEKLASLSEEERPGLVMMVIVTDGMENASREFSRTQIKEMINHQRDKYNWQFTFLGADENAFNEAVSLGIRNADAAVYGSTIGAYVATSNVLSRKRSVYQLTGGVGLVNDVSFTNEERAAMLDPSGELAKELSFNASDNED